MARTAEEYLELLQNPNVRGGLDAIRFAEGTSGDDGYRTMFGGGKFDSYDRHPDTVVHRPGYSSAAAGGYQFMPATWGEVSAELGLKDFSPRSQDIAALRLIEKRGALNELAKGGFTQSVSSKLAPEWASLPTSSGNSYYGQPVKKLSELQGVAAGGGKHNKYSDGLTGGGTSTTGIGGETDPKFTPGAPLQPLPAPAASNDPGIDVARLLGGDAGGGALIKGLEEKLAAQMNRASQPAFRMAGSPDFTEALRAQMGLIPRRQA